ncbi:MAG: glycosyltransferase [Oscillospiraceae bacterium]|nr:glycosyltransferase [Oscillospiraceae bacterium]
MQQDILVSVIVPVYKVEAYLGRCVDSILAQTHGNLEVILVDDGSPDRCGMICDEYAEKDPRVCVIHKENGGLSSARNAGIDIAKGEYLEFVDSDDWIEPDAVESLLSAALQHQVDLVIGGRWDVKEKTGEKTVGLCPEKTETVPAEEAVRRIFRWENCDSAAWDKLYHRRLFRQIRYPYGVICEDVPVTYLIAFDAGRVTFLSKPIYNYLHRQGSITYSAVSEKNFHLSRHTEKILPYIQKNYPDLKTEARYLRVRSLIYAVQSVDIASREDQKRFAHLCGAERKNLRKQLMFILCCPWFSRREKITDVLLAVNLYRPLRRFFTRQR